MRRRRTAMMMTLMATCAGTLPTSCHADLMNAGDLAFIGFNVDTPDGFAIVLLADAAPTDVVYFNDNNWDGFVFQSTMEGNFSWSPGPSGLAAGTVVTFTSLNSSPTTSAGILTGEVDGEQMSLSNDEAIYAYLGTDFYSPTTFLAAISNSPGESIANTGLSYGSTAVLLPADGTNNADGGRYVGPRTGASSFSEYVALIADTATNWVVDANNGAPAFSQLSIMSFTISSASTPEPAGLSLMLLGALMGAGHRRWRGRSGSRHSPRSVSL